MTTSDDVRKHWLREKDHLDKFGTLVKTRIGERLRALGIWADVATRTKGIDSILKKLLAKQHYTYETLPDLVGVRVVVRYRPEVLAVIAAVGDLFDCAKKFRTIQQQLDR